MAGEGTILVTGASGFIGVHLVKRLRADGRTVHALARRESDTDPLQEVGARIFFGDLKDPAALDRATAGCDRVVHLAALTSSSARSPREMEAVNCAGAVNVARAAARVGVARLVHVSTCGVYGFHCASPVRETAAIRPDTPYRRSKANGERGVLEVSRRFGLPVVVARLGIVYGPGGRNWVRLCRTLLDGSFRKIGNGRNRIHPGHVADIVEGILGCLWAPRIDGNRYNLAGPDTIAIGDLVRTLCQELGVTRDWRTWPALPFHGLRYVDLGRARFGAEVRRLSSYDLFLADRTFDISRAQGDLAYRPSVSAARGFAGLVSYYRDEGLLDPPD